MGVAHWSTRHMGSRTRVQQLNKSEHSHRIFNESDDHRKNTEKYGSPRIEAVEMTTMHRRFTLLPRPRGVNTTEQQRQTDRAPRIRVRTPPLKCRQRFIRESRDHCAQIAPSFNNGGYRYLIFILSPYLAMPSIIQMHMVGHVPGARD